MPPIPALIPGLICLTCLTGLSLAAGPAAAAREVAADAWFQRSFEANRALCAVRDARPGWCQAWLDAMEAARLKPTDLSLPEWQRVPFADNMMVCATLLPPDWCPAWSEAMEALGRDPAYTDLTDALAAQRIKEEDERQAKIDNWKAALDHVGSNRVTGRDLELIRQHVAEGDAGAMEMLGWMYLQGRGVTKDYARAYEYYGRAVLAGRADLHPTLDSLWPMLNETQKNEVRSQFK